jgi:hypothetical protein
MRYMPDPRLATLPTLRSKKCPHLLWTSRLVYHNDLRLGQELDIVGEALGGPQALNAAEAHPHTLLNDAPEL